VVEAYVGAVFVDSGYDFAKVREFFTAHILPFFEDMRLYDTFANKHPVTFLAAVMQQRLRCGEWRLLVKELPAAGEDGDVMMGILGAPQVVCAVRVHGRTLSHAVSAGSRYGKIAAAKKALQILEGMEVDDFRREYGCACALDGEALEEVDVAAHASAI
jgi:endoribonuclease Dicer